MGPLTSLIPTPRECTLGGVRFLVSEARLRDLAEIQSYLDGTVPDPLEGFGRILAEPDPEARRVALVAAYEAAEVGPPTYGTPEAAAVLATPEGRCFQLWAILRRYQPELTPRDVARLEAEMTPGEHSRILRVFHGVEPLRTIERQLLGGFRASHGPPETWGEAIDGLAVERGWTYGDIYEMTITEFNNARRHGQAEESGRTLGPGEDPVAAAAEQRRRFYGDSAPDED